MTFAVLRGIALTAAIIASASPAFAAGRACDLEGLRHYPMTDVLKTRAAPLSMARILFPDPKEKNTYSIEVGLDRLGEIKAKASLQRGLATFGPAERPVMMLATIASWTSAKDGMLSFFISENSGYIDEVLATLDSFGLKNHATLFREGKALFGPDFGTSRTRYYRWSDGSGTIRDQALDTRLKVLSERLSALPNLLQIAAEDVKSSPELKAIYDPLKASTRDDQRLSFLVSGLIDCVYRTDSIDAARTELAALPDIHRRIVIVSIFEMEMLNGSVEQFFYNSSGDLAPETVAALNSMHLKKHADAVQQGIDMFPKPYPTGTEPRRGYLEAHGPELSDRLAALTSLVDDGQLTVGMIKAAKEAGILPK